MGNKELKEDNERLQRQQSQLQTQLDTQQNFINEQKKKDEEYREQMAKEREEQKKKDEEYRQQIEKDKEEQKKREEENILRMQNEQKKREEAFNKQMEEYQNMIRAINQNNEKIRQEQEKRMQKILEEKKKKEEEMKRQFEQAKNEAEKKRIAEEQKKEKERKAKAEKVLNLFRDAKKYIIDENFEKIKEKFYEDKENFCLNQIKKFDLNEIEKLVKCFEKTEDINIILQERIKKFAQDYLEGKGSTTIKHLNIVLVGPSGVGKSTLINSVLELDQAHSAKEGEAEPCTMGTPLYYESMKVNFIRVADSRGIEKSREYGVEQVVKDVKDFVEGKLLTKDPDQFVHCIWYCITGARFEDVEKESLVTLAKIYDNNKLPIIVVYTKAIMPSLYKPIERKIKDLNLNLNFVPVVAKDILIEKEEDNSDEENDEENEGDNSKKIKKDTVKKKGTKTLMDLSVQKAEDAVQSACYTGIKNNIKDDVINNNKLQNERMELYIKQENKKRIRNFKEGMELSEMVDNISDLINYVFSYYLYDGKKSLKKDSTDKIEDFIEKFFKINLKEYKDNFEKFIEENSDVVARKLYEKQRDINYQNFGMLEFQESEEELKNQFKKKLISELKAKAELFCLMNSAYFISEPLRKYFSILLLDLFNKCLENESTKILFEESAKKMFENLKVFFEKFHKKKKDKNVNDDKGKKNQ